MSLRRELFFSFKNTFKFASLRRDSLKIRAITEFCHRHIAIATSGGAMLLVSTQDINVFSVFGCPINLATGHVGWVGDCDRGSGG